MPNAYAVLKMGATAFSITTQSKMKLSIIVFGFRLLDHCSSERVYLTGGNLEASRVEFSTIRLAVF